MIVLAGITYNLPKIFNVFLHVGNKELTDQKNVIIVVILSLVFIVAFFKSVSPRKRGFKIPHYHSMYLPIKRNRNFCHLSYWSQKRVDVLPSWLHVLVVLS